MVKVLHVFAGMNKGGVESFVMNLHKALKDSEIRFDFLLRSRGCDNKMVRYFKNIGSRIYITKAWPLHFIQNYCQMKCFFSKHADDYDYIHIHANALLYMLPVRMAVKYMRGTKMIMHSHNTRTRHVFAMPVHFVNRRILKKYQTINLACSDEAGKWMFSDRYTVIPNGIDVTRFKSESVKRACTDTVRLVSVGKIENQKNYFFMLSVIKQLKTEGMEVKYQIAGEGRLKKDLIRAVREKGISDYVELLGNIEAVEQLLKKSDIFLMPSKYEGLSIAFLEAQCSGIPCVISDRIPQTSVLCPNVYRIPLQKEKWVNAVKKIAAAKNRGFSEKNSELIEQSRYSLKGLAVSMQSVYQL